MFTFFLECENLDYIKNLIYYNNMESEIYEEEYSELSLTDIKEKKDCQQLLENASELLTGVKVGKNVVEVRRGGKSKAGDGNSKAGDGKSKAGEGKKGGKNKVDDDDSSLLSKSKKKGSNNENDKRRAKKKITKSLNNEITVERKDVLRDTKCEQDRRKNLLEEMAAAKQESDSLLNDTSSQRLAKKKGGSFKKDAKKKKEGKGTKNSKANRNSKGEIKKSPMDRPGFKPEDNDFMEGLFGADLNQFLFKYTKLPVETNSCNFLLLTKKIIYEHFTTINILAEVIF